MRPVYLESCYYYDSPSDYSSKEKGETSLRDIIKKYKSSYDWDCYDDSFDNVSCREIANDWLAGNKGKCCIGVLRSRYFSELDLFVIKSEIRNKAGQVGFDFKIIPYTHFVDWAYKVLPDGVDEETIFNRGRRRLAKKRYKFCGVSYMECDCVDTRPDFRVRYLIDCKNTCNKYSFVLATGNGLAEVNMYELRVLVAFNAVDGLYIKNNRVSLTKKAQSEFRYDSFIKYYNYNGRYSFVVPIFEFKYDKLGRDSLWEDCSTDKDSSNEFILSMYKAGFDVDLTPLAGDMIRGRY